MSVSTLGLIGNKTWSRSVPEDSAQPLMNSLWDCDEASW